MCAVRGAATGLNWVAQALVMVSVGLNSDSAVGAGLSGVLEHALSNKAKPMQLASATRNEPRPAKKFMLIL
jgi:hypothetical protein